MPGLRGLLVLLGLTGALCAQADGARPLTGADVRRLLEDHGCQVELPDGRELGRTGGRGSRFLPRSDAGISLPSCSADALLWGGVGVAAVLLVLSLARRAAAARPPERARAVVTTRERPDPAAVAGLPDHERLAAEGDFDGAVHAALVHAFACWGRAVEALPPHATGRQLLRRAAGRRGLPMAQLQSLVTIVERVHFGGRAADRDTYEQAREDLSRWEGACRAIG